MNPIPKYLIDSGAVEIKKGLKSICGGKILDVATESGNFIRVLTKVLKSYDSFIGIDISDKDWNPNKFENTPIEFLEMNAEDLKFDDNTFDTVCISHALHHLVNIAQVLQEMNRVLKSGGYFIIQESFCDGNQNKS